MVTKEERKEEPGNVEVSERERGSNGEEVGQVEARAADWDHSKRAVAARDDVTILQDALERLSGELFTFIGALQRDAMPNMLDDEEIVRGGVSGVGVQGRNVKMDAVRIFVCGENTYLYDYMQYLIYCFVKL